MFTRYRRGVSSTTIPMLAFFCATSASTALAAEKADDVISDYTASVEVEFLRVNSGVVKAKKLGEKGWHVAIEVPPTKTRSRSKCHDEDDVRLFCP